MDNNFSEEVFNDNNSFDDFFSNSIDELEVDTSISDVIDNSVEDISNKEELSRINFAKDIIKAYRVNESEDDFNERVKNEIQYEPYVKYNIFLSKIVKDNDVLSKNKIAQFLIVSDLCSKLKEMCELNELKEILSSLEDDYYFTKDIKETKNKGNLYINKLTPLEIKVNYKLDSDEN